MQAFLLNNYINIFKMLLLLSKQYTIIATSNEKQGIKMLSSIFKKAMVDSGVSGNKQLSELAGISYEKTMRIMKDQPSAKLVDVVAIATCLGLKLKFIKDAE
jgi:hypothetical protein